MSSGFISAKTSHYIKKFLNHSLLIYWSVVISLLNTFPVMANLYNLGNSLVNGSSISFPEYNSFQVNLSSVHISPLIISTLSSFFYFRILLSIEQEIAVSILSPVAIFTLFSAFSKSKISSSVPLLRLFLTMINPRNSKSFS